MYKVGDVVEIHKGNNAYCVDGSSLDILDGTIAKIVEIHTNRPTLRNTVTYDLEFIELHIKDGYNLEGYEETSWWRDEHLRVVCKDINIKDIDIMNLFKGD